jgi:hypothetical protein
VITKEEKKNINNSIRYSTDMRISETKILDTVIILCHHLQNRFVRQYDKYGLFK